MQSAYTLLSSVSLIVWLAAILVCFLKGRAGFAWFGVVMFAMGAALNTTGWRYWRNGAIDDWWWWVFIAQGLVVLVAVAIAALRPARPDSWLYRRRHDRRTHQR